MQTEPTLTYWSRSKLPTRKKKWKKYSWGIGSKRRICNDSIWKWENPHSHVRKQRTDKNDNGKNVWEGIYPTYCIHNGHLHLSQLSKREREKKSNKLDTKWDVAIFSFTLGWALLGNATFGSICRIEWKKRFVSARYLWIDEI